MSFRASSAAAFTAAWACFIAAMSLLAFSAWRDSPPSAIATLTALAMLPYAAFAFVPCPLSSRLQLYLALGSAVVCGAMLLPAAPSLSDDIYRYLWDGKVTTSGISPYRYAPQAPELFHLRDASWWHINFKSIHTIYPPVAQAFFALSAWASKTDWMLRGMLLVCHLGTTYLVYRIAGQHESPESASGARPESASCASRERSGRAALLIGCNPLAIEETCHSGHVDALAATLLCGSVWLAMRGKLSYSATVASAATGVKLIGAALLPVFAKGFKRRPLLVFVLVTMIWATPVLVSTTGVSQDGHAHKLGIIQYATRWEGQGSVFLVLKAGTDAALSGVAWLQGNRTTITLNWARPFLDALRGTPLDPWQTVLPPESDQPNLARFPIDYLSGLIARLVVLALAAALAAALAVRGVEALVAARTMVLAVLLLTPQFHPWYLLWLLPLDLALGKHVAIIWSAASLASYAPLDRWVASRMWHAPPWAHLMEYAMVFCAIAIEERQRCLHLARGTIKALTSETRDNDA